jgi:hypothetical protein
MVGGLNKVIRLRGKVDGGGVHRILAILAGVRVGNTGAGAVECVGVEVTGCCGVICFTIVVGKSWDFTGVP